MWLFFYITMLTYYCKYSKNMTLQYDNYLQSIYQVTLTVLIDEKNIR